MSIELHCPKCGKQIRAPENAGGKHGKCPYCEGRVYIPMPPAPEDEIGVAPVDDDFERREAELRRELIAFEAKLSMENKLAPAPLVEKQRGGESASGGEEPEVAGEVIDCDAEVENFITAMRDSRLDDAEEAVASLRRAGPRARDFVQGALVDEMPPEVSGVPPPVLKGFLKTLLTRLK